MKDLKALKLYAKNRKLPEAVMLGTIPKDWVTYARSLSKALPETNKEALDQRNNMNVVGTEIVDYENLTTFYNQKYLNDIQLPEEIKQLEGVHHLRFGVLQPKSVIPFHLDEPYTLRFICVVEGSHNFHTETGSVFKMNAGELWFINGSFKHSVENEADNIRVALLGKFDASEKNKKLIYELL